jgi:hypothetical protein
MAAPKDGTTLAIQHKKLKGASIDADQATDPYFADHTNSG